MARNLTLEWFKFGAIQGIFWAAVMLFLYALIAAALAAMFAAVGVAEGTDIISEINSHLTNVLAIAAAGGAVGVVLFLVVAACYMTIYGTITSLAIAFNRFVFTKPGALGLAVFQSILLIVLGFIVNIWNPFAWVMYILGFVIMFPMCVIEMYIMYILTCFLYNLLGWEIPPFGSATGRIRFKRRKR